jgi:phosphate transport system substrate-binding protein
MTGRSLVRCLLLAGVVPALVTSPSSAKLANEVDISTAAIFAPLLRQIVMAYGAANPDVTVLVREGSYGEDLRDLEGGAADVAIVDRAPASGTTYTDRALAIVPYAIIADLKTGVASLSSAQVADVFAGRTTNWSQVGGADLPIVAIERPANSGTTALFASVFGPTTAGGVTVDNTSSAVVNGVRTQPGGIGYVGMPYAPLDGVRILVIGGAQPSPEAIASGRYKFFATIHAVTAGPPPPIVSRFLSFAESRRELLHAAGFYTIFETKQSR